MDDNVDDSPLNSGSNDCNGAGSDRLLPIAVVGRLMKRALPPGAKISKEAKETMQECATEFIGFVTGEAAERCRKEKRKTVNGDDICFAFKAIGLDEYGDVMKKYLERYRLHGEKGSGSAGKQLDKSIQIDVRDELSVFRSTEQSRKQQKGVAATSKHDQFDHDLHHQKAKDSSEPRGMASRRFMFLC